MNFRIDLDIFRGPMDLLLYLVRKHEVDILDIPIAPITEQFLKHLAVLEQLDVNWAGDFLEVASQLIEIKSQMVLPRAGEIEDELEDPRQELVKKLLEYKKYKDAASILEERSRDWQQRFARLADDLPPRQRNLAEQPVDEVELWDLVSVFGRILRDKKLTETSNIIYDDTPIHVYTQMIHSKIVEQGRLAFSELFQHDMHKSALIGIFLAILELVRHKLVRAEQSELFKEIWVYPGSEMPEKLDWSTIDNYDHAADPEE